MGHFTPTKGWHSMLAQPPLYGGHVDQGRTIGRGSAAAPPRAGRPQPKRTSRVARLLVGASLIAGVLVLVAPGVAQAATAPVMKVSGNHLVAADGSPLHLYGVNRDGAEYRCASGVTSYGIWDGPVDDEAVAAIAAWKANVVRIPVNEECWLGVNGVDPARSGATYEQAVVGFVNRLNQHGMAAIIDLQSGGPGTTLAKDGLGMPDADHSPAFWTSVAATFKGNPSVMFNLYNEPHGAALTWACWRDGCTYTGTDQDFPAGVTYAAAGMQSLVDAVRGTGATNPILLDGLAYSSDLSGWVANQPNDPAHQLVADFHVYDFATCTPHPGCWTTTIAPVAAQVPVLTGEIGQASTDDSFVKEYMAWADGTDGIVGYLGWTWNANAEAGYDYNGTTDQPILISHWDGTPTTMGAAIKAHFATLAASVPGGTKPVDRIAGPDRIATAIAVSQDQYPNGHAAAAVLARDDVYADALTGVPLAVALHGPLLLNGTAGLDSRVGTELQRVLAPGSAVALLGGTSSLSDALASQVAALGFIVQRVGGADRYATAVAVADQLGDPSTVYEVTGADTTGADALCAGPAAAVAHGAILLTAGRTQAPATSAYLGAHPGSRVAIGGPAVAADPAASAIAGPDRYDTCARVATHTFPHPTRVAIANGGNPVDGLAGGALMGAAAGPVLLVDGADGGSIPSAAQTYLQTTRSSISSGIVFGGIAAVPEASKTAFSSAIG